MRAFVLGVLTVGMIGCANDPEYIPAPKVIDAGTPDPAQPNALIQGKQSLTLPFKKETAADQKTRAALAKTLAPVQVPYVKVGDIEVELEWTIRNLDQKAGQAKIEINGANEFFSYDPTIINLTPNDDEAPP